MKIDTTTYTTMLNAMHALVEHCGGPLTIRTHYATRTQGFMLWELWHVADRNLRYDDTHPGFAQNHWTRICPTVPGFDLYKSRDINDSHILTALRKIGKALNIID